MQFNVPAGFRLAGVHCGIKSEAAKEDLALIVTDAPAVAAGVYTQNVVRAASVIRNETLTPTDRFRALVVNSGNANACTGERGAADNAEVARQAAQVCGADTSQALVMSTGIIGEYLPMERIAAGINAAFAGLGTDEPALMSAARGIITTDKGTKVASRTIDISGRTITLTGIAKGAGMIGPRMATMLAAVMTDAPLSKDDAQQALTTAVNVSFNCISVEGHTSTSDTVLLLASGAAGGDVLNADDLSKFRAALAELCTELARMIPDDGEGASHLININVRGCKTYEDAHQIAKTIANSSLVKTGVAGADPNWGRVVCAAGYSGVVFNPDGLTLSLNGIHLYEKGTPVPFDEIEASNSIKNSREVFFLVELSEGDASATFWTSDLTMDYVRFNSEYHT